MRRLYRAVAASRSRAVGGPPEQGPRTPYDTVGHNGPGCGAARPPASPALRRWLWPPPPLPLGAPCPRVRRCLVCPLTSGRSAAPWPPAVARETLRPPALLPCRWTRACPPAGPGAVRNRRRQQARGSSARSGSGLPCGAQDRARARRTPTVSRGAHGQPGHCGRRDW